MNKGIVCIVLLGILLSIVTCLQIYVDTFLNTINSKIKLVESSISIHSEQVDNNETNEYFDDLKNYWDNQIPYLSLMINYKDIAPIGEAISRLEAGIESNDYTTSNTETKLLLRITQALQKIFGIRLPNLL